MSTTGNIERVPDLPVRVLDDGDEVSFDATDSKAPTPGQSLGTAEFAFCTKWERGKLKAVHITPMQQRHRTELWRIDHPGAQSFSVGSWTHKGVSEPRPWIYFWCKEHGCMGMRVYVPRDSDHFTARVMSDISIYFDRRGA